MVKVFLVEDEKIVREGIKNGIPWENTDLNLPVRLLMENWLFR